MKIVLIKAREGKPAGTVLELSDELASQAIQEGIARTEADHLTIQASENAVKAVRAEQLEQRTKTIKAKIAAAKTRGAVPPKDETVEATAVERLGKGVDFEVLCELIDGMAGTQTVAASGRQTTSTEGVQFERLQLQGVSLADAGKAYVTAREPMSNLIKAGNWKEATKLSKDAGFICQTDIMSKVQAGGDFMLRDVIKAADFTDPDSQVGTLATGLVIMRNLGYLVNKLAFLKYVSTDLSAEPAKFKQPILTRYITPPGVLTYVPGVGFTSDATTIATAGTGTDQGAGATQTVPAAGNNYLAPVKSVPSTTDVTVTMNQFKATEVEFGIGKLAGTVRNLFGEQRGAQLYSLAENINQHFLATLYAANWTATTGGGSYVKALGQWDLKGMIGLKNAATIAKMPDTGRFSLLHSFYYDKLLEDANMLSAQAILALINKDSSSFSTSDLPVLFGLKPMESQLSAATNAGALTTWTDAANPGTTNIAGFTGNMSSMMFVSRPPQDFNAIASQLGVPTTSAVELVTEPESGLTVMVFKYVDNGKMSISQRVCLMWGDAQGDPRQGIVLKLS